MLINCSQPEPVARANPRARAADESPGGNPLNPPSSAAESDRRFPDAVAGEFETGRSAVTVSATSAGNEIEKLLTNMM